MTDSRETNSTRDAAPLLFHVNLCAGGIRLEEILPSAGIWQSVSVRLFENIPFKAASVSKVRMQEIAGCIAPHSNSARQSLRGKIVGKGVSHQAISTQAPLGSTSSSSKSSTSKRMRCRSVSRESDQHTGTEVRLASARTSSRTSSGDRAHALRSDDQPEDWGEESPHPCHVSCRSFP